jgi:3-oxoacyl-[acyl-carrier protein] reductase
MPAVGAALVTGVSRRRGIAAAAAARLRQDGWAVFTTGWRPYDAEMAWGRDDDQVVDLEEDLLDPHAPARVVAAAEHATGPLRALVNVHTVDTGGGLMDMTPELIDRHLAVNVRATLLLMREFVLRLRRSRHDGGGRIVSFTSNLPQTGAIAYAASKGAIEWLTVSAATELGPDGITVNAVDPGPNQSGWMTAEIEQEAATRTPLGRVGRPEDAAALVAFLLSNDGGWVNGQVISSDGGHSVNA